jgi:succinate-semialdehyde dehydrogenase/glutarate-semialdehyde dehydrogenase
MNPAALQDSALLRHHCLIDGTWVAAENGAELAVTNPATGEMLGTVPAMGGAETARAIAVAERALPGWRGQTAAARAALLRRWHGLMLEHQDDLARLMTLEQGKPLAEARGEVAYAASYFEWFAEEGRRVYGDVIPSPFPDRRIVEIGRAHV